MSHKGFSSVFNELAKCRGLSNEDLGTTSIEIPRADSANNDEIVATCSVNIIDENLSINSIQDDQILHSESDFDSTIANILENSMKIK